MQRKLDGHEQPGCLTAVPMFNHPIGRINNVTFLQTSPIVLALTPFLATNFWWELHLESTIDAYADRSLGRISSYEISEQSGTREVDFREDAADWSNNGL